MDLELIPDPRRAVRSDDRRSGQRMSAGRSSSTSGRSETSNGPEMRVASS